MFKKAQISLKFLGILAGIMIFSGVAFAGGMKYTEGPNFCSTCHVMDPMFEAWKASPHQQAASCNDCHAPADKGSKYIFKATSGAGHLYANLTGVPEVIEATQKSSDIIQQNCLRCHSQLVEDTKMGGGKYCIECHRSTYHSK